MGHLGSGLQTEAMSRGRKHWACPASSDPLITLQTLHLVKCWSSAETRSNLWLLTLWLCSEARFAKITFQK